MAIAVVGGLVTGYLIHIEWIFNPLKDHELFEDELFFDGVGYEDDIDPPVEDATANVSTVEQTFQNQTSLGKVFSIIKRNLIYFFYRQRGNYEWGL